MSDYVGPEQVPENGSSTVGAAKQEAAEVKDVAAGAAKDVAGTAKQEAATVAGEAKDQARDLYGRAKQELGGQAAKQQERLATGLGAVGEQFGSMAGNADGGVAADLAQRASDRLGAAASWLQDRDPATVLDDVKAFARRRPGVFIAGAAVAGIVIGRLTRALAASAADAKAASASDGAGDALRGPTYGDADTGSSAATAFTTGGAVAGGAVYPAADAASGDVFATHAYLDDQDAAVVEGDVIVIDDSGDSPLYDGSVAGYDDRGGYADDRRDSV